MTPSDFEGFAASGAGGSVPPAAATPPSPPIKLTEEQVERLRSILDRVLMARRELDALIGDNYLSPRVNIVALHFNSLAAAVEKLRWAEAQWRELSAELGLDKDV